MAHETRTSASLLDELVDEYASRAFDFLERLVREPSLLGTEERALRVLGDELARLGFGLERLPIPADIKDDPAAGIPTHDYDGRSVLVARRGRWAASNGWRSLLINGHVDVVPAGSPKLWSGDPFRPRRMPDGRLTGRGSGDMKGGFAMATLALEALATARPESREWPIAVVGVIEEECTGNGTLASIRAGVTGDAVLIPEPTGLTVRLGGVGVIWVDVITTGMAAHAHEGRGVSAAAALQPIIAGLERLSDDLNADHQPPDSDWREAYRMNIGMVRAGDWRSSVPGEARIGVRFGFPSDWTPEEAEQRIHATVDEIANGDAWLRSHPPVVELTGLRAQGYALNKDEELVQVMLEAHLGAHGSLPALTGTDGTTDARFYRNELEVPALCYGPLAHGIHGANESVDLGSIVDGARTLTRALPAWIEKTL